MISQYYSETLIFQFYFQQAKNQLMKAFLKSSLGTWLKKPIEQDQFEIEIDAQAWQMISLTLYFCLTVLVLCEQHIPFSCIQNDAVPFCLILCNLAPCYYSKCSGHSFVVWTTCTCNNFLLMNMYFCIYFEHITLVILKHFKLCVQMYEFFTMIVDLFKSILHLYWKSIWIQLICKQIM